MTHVSVTPPDKAEGRLKEAYEQVKSSRGAVGNVYEAMSHNPAAMQANHALYTTLQFGESPLSRRERELVATVVSRITGCNYCLAHHADAFGRHAREAGLQALVATDYTRAPLSDRERALADHAARLTREPAAVHEADIKKLRDAGLDDREITDLTLLVAYFNFITRAAIGLGVSTDDVAGAFKY